MTLFVKILEMKHAVFSTPIRRNRPLNYFIEPIYLKTLGKESNPWLLISNLLPLNPELMKFL